MFQHKTFQARLTIIDKRKRKNKRLWGATTTENHNRQPSFNQHQKIHKIAAKFKRPAGAETNIEPPGAKVFLSSLIIDLPLHEAMWQGSTPKEEHHRRRYQGQPRLGLE
jgi:hypothetical protein